MKVKYKKYKKKEWRIWSFEVRERIEVEKRGRSDRSEG